MDIHNSTELLPINPVNLKILKSRYLFFLPALLLLSIQAFSQKKTPLPPEFSIKKSETEAHMRFLAADELLGRRTGEQGNLVAARYIAEQFRKLGVLPVPGNTTSGTSTYYQNVPFEKMGSNGSGEIVAGDEHLKSGEDWILMNGEATDITAPLVYAGFGLENAAKGWDDYKGLDVKGKIVLLQSGTPDVQTPSEIIASSTEKRKLAAEKGAVAIIELFNAPMPWNMVNRYFAGERIALADAKDGSRKSIPHAWVNGKEAKITRALRAVQSVTFKTSGRKSQLVNSYNVAGFIQGTDPTLKK